MTPSNSTGPRMVVPRAGPLDSDANLPLEKWILPILNGRTKGTILILSSPGEGKSTAIRYLRTVLPVDGSVQCFDVNQAPAAKMAAETGVVVLAADAPFPGIKYLLTLRLRPWTIDDCLEYLLANHRQKCGLVLARLMAGESIGPLGGCPELLTLVIDAMAFDPGLNGWRDALRLQAVRVMPTAMQFAQIIAQAPIEPPLNADQQRWWRHKPTRQLCVAHWIVGQLKRSTIPDQLYHMNAARDVIDDVAAEIKNEPDAIDFIRNSVTADPRMPPTGVLVSILIAVDPAWRPYNDNGAGMSLKGARLAGAKWADVDLAGAFLSGADLTGADLSGANLTEINANKADFSGVNLQRARLTRANFWAANLRNADLSNAVASNADFNGADLRSAILRSAKMQGTDCSRANFTEAVCEGADFSGAVFWEVNFEHADFLTAVFHKAKFEKADLSTAKWTGANFTRATLDRCNLEGLDLPGARFEQANLSGSLLTGSRIVGGRFDGANLTDTGLADVDWEGADLRGADLSKASFHMGSSRSGLVGSVTPSEGSRTGFYTDDFNDQSYKPAEEIRKASLVGANLSGAVVNKTDFYLVDLRNAVYSKEQGKHFARTGAILRGNEPG